MNHAELAVYDIEYQIELGLPWAIPDQHLAAVLKTATDALSSAAQIAWIINNEIMK